MAGSRLPEPVLYVALDAVEKIQGGEDSASALWSVFSRAKDAVKNGRRLENMSWRLWHCARVMPRRQLTPPFSAGLPSYPEMLLRPLSSPSHSFTSSSEGTAAGSDWDRDTAVGEDDEVLHPGLHGSGARRKPVVSPHLNKVHLKLSSGISNIATALTRSTPASAPSLHRIHHNHDDGAPFRQFPHSGHSDSAPHQPPQTDTDACPYVAHERVQGISYSDLRYHGASPTPVAGDDALSAPQVSKHIFPVRDLNSLPTYTIARSPPSGSIHPVFLPQEIHPIVTSSSMPTVLPSLADSRKDILSVGRFIADLLPQKKSGAVSRKLGPEGKVHIQGAFQSNEAQSRTLAPHADLPQIVEPLHSTPPLGRDTSTLLGNTSPSSTSPTPSAAATPRQVFPTVVVVNPTPHPTPPATPSPDVSEAPYGLRPTAAPFEHPGKRSDDWVGASNGQLATPQSLNGDSHPLLPPTGPTFLMDGPKNPPINGQPPQVLNADVTVLPLRTSLLPAAAITFPGQVNATPASQLLTPSSNPRLEMSGSSSRSTPSAPIPAPEDKKFFLAALHNSSGHESSESPDSLGGASISPQKAPQIGKDIPPALQAARSCEDEVASSFSAGSSGGARPHSVASSRGGGQTRHKGRAGFNVAGGTRRRQGPKKIVMATRQAARMEKEVESKETDGSVPKTQEETRVRSKGKERAVGERCEDSKSRPSIAGEQHVSPPKSQQKLPRSPAPLLPQNLRHLPTNPPRQQAQASVGQAVPDATIVASTGPQLNSRQLPLYPPLGHLGLAHLPTVPPRQRRPIEITETSSEYETTDSDESSWESESISGDEAGEGEGRSRSARVSGGRGSRTAGASTSTRTRGTSEFQRDAEREKQRARELFQKLPPRSYSHVGQLPRTKSGLSQLFHPDPALFPDGHPYRTSHSSRDILARNWSAPGMPLAMTQVSRSGAVAGPMQAIVNVQSVGMGASPREAEGINTQRASGQHTKYMRKGPPQDQEQETDSGDDDPEDTIQVSSSVAQRRLAAIMGQQVAKTPRSQRRPTPLRTASHPEVQAQASSSQQIVRTTTAPMVMHPYLPDPAPLQTPHTVRRNIISQELDEELRRNLLWERSQNQIQGRPARAPGSILPGPWRSLTPLRPEESRETQSNSDRGPGQRTFATQRTKSWAGDYHAAGW